MAVAVSPFFLWLAAITALPHKEERFLFVVYPLASFLLSIIPADVWRTFYNFTVVQDFRVQGMKYRLASLKSDDGALFDDR